VVSNVEPLCRDLRNENFFKKTQETQETHVVIFCIPLISLTLRKGMGKIEEIPETQERQETHETPALILFSFLTGEQHRGEARKKAHLW